MKECAGLSCKNMALRIRRVWSGFSAEFVVQSGELKEGEILPFALCVPKGGYPPGKLQRAFKHSDSECRADRAATDFRLKFTAKNKKSPDAFWASGFRVARDYAACGAVTSSGFAVSLFRSSIHASACSPKCLSTSVPAAISAK